MRGRRLVLTPREIEVIDLIRHGHNRRQIAETLCISPYTVNNHLRNTFRKLGANSQAEAVGEALKRKLI